MPVPAGTRLGPMLSRRRFAQLLATTPLLQAQRTDSPKQESFDGVERLIAIGDVHGDYEVFVTLLRTTKLIGANGTSWTGGKAHLVLPGDFIDRGNASRKVMDLLMSLEERAASAGGQVHALLGNHETMNVFGDWRYVVRADYEAFRGVDSEDLRQQALEAAWAEARRGTVVLRKAEFQKKFEAEHPLGWVERQRAFSAEGKYGKWLRQKNAVIKVNDLVFLHGGISPKYATADMNSINQGIREELADPGKAGGGIALDPDGPLWYRGLVELPESDRAPADAAGLFLKNHDARHMVVGHTPVLAIVPRFQGKVFAIDVGLSAAFGGPPACLLVESGRYYAMHRGRKVDFPVDGAHVADYLRTVATLEPPDSKLRRSLNESQR